ncbi:hypothetical protein PIB30_007782 [Stylosanthes scabra]|uniref:DUF1685 family protein n=1 Tax=Stylosanthes scabra TaxID=79078 RepID=A0ABU6Z5B7_9FABA|nr:hypothetical protein [Stylosanthes scabra]
METEAAVLNLFDSCWFELNVLMKTSTITPSKATSSFAENLNHKEEEERLESASKLARIQTSTHHSRSMSDQSMEATSFKHESMSPDSVLMIHSKLQTILSGKEATDSEEEPHQKPSHEAAVLSPKENIIMMKKNNKKRETKSLSDLEFEELKGFMDLGFVFSEEDKDSTLASIIPGLQRLGKKENSDSDEQIMVQRPYLSEAWEVYSYDKKRKEKENPLMNWKFPAVSNETDIKDSLRWWAHTVASTVR